MSCTGRSFAIPPSPAREKNHSGRLCRSSLCGPVLATMARSPSSPASTRSTSARVSGVSRLSNITDNEPELAASALLIMVSWSNEVHSGLSANTAIPRFRHSTTRSARAP